MRIYQYDPLKVDGTFYGVRGSIDIVDGALYGDFLMITKDVPLFERDTDGFGNSVRIKNNNIGGTIALELSASSPTNDKLSELVLIDYMTEVGTGFMSLNDRNSDTQIVATGVFVRDFPQITYGVNRGVRSWIFECAAIQVLLLRGHNKV